MRKNRTLEKILAAGIVGLTSITSLRSLSCAPQTSVPEIPSFPNQNTTTKTYRFVKSWGGMGYEDGQFYHPFGIAVDEDGYVYVADTGNNRIQKFTSNGEFVRKWGEHGFGKPGTLGSPWDVTVSPNGNIWVADGFDIQEYTSLGEFIRKWGSYGENPEQFRNAYRLCVSSLGYVYVADDIRRSVKQFTINGDFVKEWGTGGSPGGIAVDSRNFIYVSDDDRFKINKYTSSGEFITSFGDLVGIGISTDDMRNVYVGGADGEIYGYRSNGILFAKFPNTNDGSNTFNCVFDVDVDKSGNIYTIDTDGCLVRKFAPQ